MFWIIKYLLYLAGGIAGCNMTFSAGFVFYLAFLQPSFYFPQPTGRYAVGIKDYHWVDVTRKAPAQGSATGKELMVSIWYPSSEDKAARKPIAPYAPYHINYLKQHQKINWLLMFSRPMYTYAKQDAPLIDGSEQLPVIIFSHGFGCTRNTNTAHCEELASQGYVVVGISHTYGGSVIQFPDGSIQAPNQEEMEQQLKNPLKCFKTINDNIDIWVDDVQMALDHLEQLSADRSSPLFNRLNMNKIGMVGHSYGGAATAQLCRRDSRIKAGVSMDGPLFGSHATVPFDKPFMFLLAPSMTQAEMLTLIKKSPAIKEEEAEEFCAAQYQSFLPAIDNLIRATNHDVYKITIKDIAHLAFCDMAIIKEACVPALARLLANCGTGSLNGYRATDIINKREFDD